MASAFAQWKFGMKSEVIHGNCYISAGIYQKSLKSVLQCSSNQLCPSSNVTVGKTFKLFQEFTIGWCSKSPHLSFDFAQSTVKNTQSLQRAQEIFTVEIMASAFAQWKFGMKSEVIHGNCYISAGIYQKSLKSVLQCSSNQLCPSSNVTVGKTFKLFQEFTIGWCSKSPHLSFDFAQSTVKNTQSLQRAQEIFTVEIMASAFAQWKFGMKSEVIHGNCYISAGIYQKSLKSVLQCSSNQLCPSSNVTVGKTFKLFQEFTIGWCSKSPHLSFDFAQSTVKNTQSLQRAQEIFTVEIMASAFAQWKFGMKSEVIHGNCYISAGIYQKSLKSVLQCSSNQLCPSSNVTVGKTFKLFQEFTIGWCSKSPHLSFDFAQSTVKNTQSLQRAQEIFTVEIMASAFAQLKFGMKSEVIHGNCYISAGIYQKLLKSVLKCSSNQLCPSSSVTVGRPQIISELTIGWCSKVHTQVLILLRAQSKHIVIAESIRDIYCRDNGISICLIEVWHEI
eukprot:403345132